MNTGIFTLRKRGLAVAAALLLAVALTAGTLFAANERQQQPELPAVSQQSVMDATDPIRAVQPPEAPPAPPTRLSFFRGGNLSARTGPFRVPWTNAREALARR